MVIVNQRPLTIPLHKTTYLHITHYTIKQSMTRDSITRSSQTSYIITVDDLDIKNRVAIILWNQMKDDMQFQ